MGNQEMTDNRKNHYRNRIPRNGWALREGHPCSGEAPWEDDGTFTDHLTEMKYRLANG